MTYTLRDYQQASSDAAVRFFKDSTKKNGLLILPTGCHAKGTKVLMWNDEPKCVEDICVGDMLVNAEGQPTKVVELHHGFDTMYEITPLKGDPFVVNGGHILSLYKTNEGGRFKGGAPRIDEISVRDYVNQSANYKHLHKLRRVKSVEFSNSSPLPLNPYLLGLIIGDGCTSYGTVSITTMRTEVVDFLYRYAEKNNMRISVHLKSGKKNKAKTYVLCSATSKKNSNRVLAILRDLGICQCVAGDKYIPTIYKVASKLDRLILLAGLLDTDAHYDSEKCGYEYCSKSKRLADDVVFLCRSLGFFAKIGKTKIVKGESYYRIYITGELSAIPTKVRIRWGDDRIQKKSLYVTGFSIKKVGLGEYFGFTVEGDHLYCDEQFFIHHNSGKSLVIADLASRLDGDVLVFQPSREILAQNYAKLLSYGEFDCSIYSASFNRKEISRITFATIGSVKAHKEDFNHFKYIIVDEAHVTNPKEGMYKEFFECADRKILGLTATPYRLCSTRNQYGDPCCILKFLTRTRPRIFTEVVYQVDISTLLQRGYLAQMRYFDMTVLPPANIKRNTTGMDFDEEDLKMHIKNVDLHIHLINIIRRLLAPKVGGPRKGILVFTKFLEESQAVCDAIPGSEMVSGDTPKKERDRILTDFKEGRIKVLTNCGVLTTGFDYPELDTVVLARPTMSLALYYQIVGRAIRPHPDKVCSWIVDLAGNYQRFGRVEDLHLSERSPGMYAIDSYSNGHIKPLTNVYF